MESNETFELQAKGRGLCLPVEFGEGDGGDPMLIHVFVRGIGKGSVGLET